MAKLSKTTEYAIQYLLTTGKSAKEVADELNVTVRQVQKFVKVEEEVKTSTVKTDKTKDLMIRQTSAKKNNSVSIMTQAASQVGDEFYKAQNNTAKDTSGHIFRPRG